MMMKHWIAGIGLAVVLWAATSGTVSAGVWCVSKAGSDATGDGSTNAPWASITNAVARSGIGDTIQVAAGVYTQSVTMATTNVTIQGGFNPANWSWDPATQRSAIYGNGNAPIVLLAPATTNAIQRLTLYGGATGSKAGIQVTASNGTLLVDGCSVTGNLYGVYVTGTNATLTLRNTLIARNTSHAVYLDLVPIGGGSFRLLNCTVATNGGSGTFLRQNTPGTAPTLWATNSLFTGNGSYGMTFGAPSVGVDNCLFYGNIPGAWSGGGNAANDGGHNKVGQDPRFVDAVNDNYRLQGDSPAAAAGANLTAAWVTNDIVNTARPGTYGWDMGAYQSNGTGAPPPVAVAYVSKLGSDSSGDGSQGSPWATATYGLGRLNATGTLYVASGVYTDNVTLYGGAQTIRGGYDPATWTWDPAHRRTAIYGKGYSPLTLLLTSQTNTLSALTLYGGTNSAMSGVNVQASFPAQLNVDGCAITGNVYGVQTGNFRFQLLLRNSVIARNSNHGIYAATSVYGNGNVVSNCVLNCTITDNGGSGIYETLDGGSGRAAFYAINTLITSNKGYGVYLKANDFASGSSVGYSLWNGNASGFWYGTNNYGTVAFPDGGNNITNQDPRYVGAAAGDYRLAGTSSPACNSGTNLLSAGVTNDIVGVLRPQMRIFDRGAYELLPPVGSTVLFR